METGGLLMILPGCGFLFPLMLPPIHKALIWLLAAIIADILPVVSSKSHVPILSTYHDFLSQVFICLNLNGEFPFLSILLTKNTDVWIRFCSKY